MKIAVIDTGTNSTRMLVAEVGGGRVEELERLTTITRLGEGVDSGGTLHVDSRARVLACVERYTKRISDLGASRTIVLATSSLRDARDGEEFLSSLAAAHGFRWKLLTGEEEARLSFSGAIMGTGPLERVALFDVGGGSTEVVVGVGGRVEFFCSLGLGCVRLTERFIKSDPIDNQELERLSAFVEDTLEREIDLSRLKKPVKTLAVAGTATALAAIDLGLKTYDSESVHGHVISSGRIAELLRQLAAMTVAQRLDITVMEKGRADVIVAGTMILERLMIYTGADELVVSESDILDGAALAMAAEKI
jgi:exopolyphosphatase/guanosine-5'-triphosphate,3'-diphosphate pyrophosphatase